MKITQNIFIRQKNSTASKFEPLQSKFYERFSPLFFLRALGEIVNKIMISLMEIYYPSNIGLGISKMMLLQKKLRIISQQKNKKAKKRKMKK